MKKIRRNKTSGITLIALVVTIIVLLILAGISIQMLSGNNGILNKAGDARDDTIVGQEKEQVELAYISAAVKKLGDNVDKDDLQDELDIVVGDDKTTVTGNNKLTVTFTDTQNAYKVTNGKVEKKDGNSNVLDVDDLNEDADTYLGLKVINYSDTLPSELQDMEWQLLWAGPIDENDTNSRIYLISKNNIESEKVPTVIKNGVDTGAKPIGSDSSFAFGEMRMSHSGNYFANGIIGQYNGATNITNTQLQNLNKKYFQYITENNKTSNTYSMKAVAFMMDTTTWGNFKTSKAEYAVGGPSVELLLNEINAINRANNGTLYETIVEEEPEYSYSPTIGTGYKFRAVGEESYEKEIKVEIGSISDGKAFWLASPSITSFNNATGIDNTGVFCYYGYSRVDWRLCGHVLSSSIGFRPVVCLSSGTELEKIKDSNNNDVLRIVE